MLETFVAILSDPAVILGIIAAVGLIALRKSVSDIIKGTFKTLFGFFDSSARG